MDCETFDILGRWEIDRGPQKLHYDFWWNLPQPLPVVAVGLPRSLSESRMPEIGTSGLMAAYPNTRPEIGSAALDHAPGVDAVHRPFGQRVGAASGGAEQGSLAAVCADQPLSMGLLADPR